MALPAGQPMETTALTRNGIRWLPAVIAFLLFMALGVLLAFGIAQARGGSSPKLEAAPDFTVPLYSGGTGQFTLSKQRGHPVVLNFWGSWCPPCRAEFPALQTVADKNKERGLIVMGVNSGGIIRDTESEAKEFLREQGTTFFTGPDTPGSQILIAYRVANFPTTFFITPNGRIYKKWVGQIDETRLNTFIEELLDS